MTIDNSEDEQLPWITLSDHLALESLRDSGLLLHRLFLGWEVREMLRDSGLLPHRLFPGWEVREMLRDLEFLESVRGRRFGEVRRRWEVLELVREGEAPE